MTGVSGSRIGACAAAAVAVGTAAGVRTRTPSGRKGS